MAITKCPECEGLLSTEAKKCPHCGYSLSKNKKSSFFSSKKRVVISSLILIVVIVVVLIGLYLTPIVKLGESSTKKVNDINSNIAKISATLYLNDYKTINNLYNDYSELNIKEKLNVSNSKVLKESYDYVVNLKINNTEKQIEKIGKVTLNSGNNIKNAQSEFDDLEKKFQSKVKNAAELKTKTQQYNDMLVNNIVERIGAMESFDYKSVNKLQDLEKDYSELSDELKQKITNYDKLQQARKTYDENCNSQISKIVSNIKKVKISDKDSVNKAKDIYETLSEEGKSNCKCYDKIKQYEKDIEKLEAKKLQAERKAKKNKAKEILKSKFSSEYDNVNDITFYMPKTYPKYINTRSYVLPYLVVSNESIKMRTTYNYTGTDWIFWKEIVFKIDGEKHEKYVDYYSIVRDVGGGGDVCEYYHSIDDINYLRLIADSKSAIIRFRGDSKYEDITISASDKQAIKDALTVYDLWNY